MTLQLPLCLWFFPLSACFPQPSRVLSFLCLFPLRAGVQVPRCSLVPAHSFSSGVGVFMATRDPISCLLSPYSQSLSTVSTNKYSLDLAGSFPQKLDSARPCSEWLSMTTQETDHTLCLTSYFLCHLSAKLVTYQMLWVPKCPGSTGHPEALQFSGTKGRGNSRGQ